LTFNWGFKKIKEPSQRTYPKPLILWPMYMWIPNAKDQVQVGHAFGWNGFLTFLQWQLYLSTMACFDFFLFSMILEGYHKDGFLMIFKRYHKDGFVMIFKGYHKDGFILKKGVVWKNQNACQSQTTKEKVHRVTYPPIT